MCTVSSIVLLLNWWIGVVSSCAFKETRAQWQQKQKNMSEIEQLIFCDEKLVGRWMTGLCHGHLKWRMDPVHDSGSNHSCWSLTWCDAKSPERCFRIWKSIAERDGGTENLEIKSGYSQDPNTGQFNIHYFNGEKSLDWSVVIYRQSPVKYQP